MDDLDGFFFGSGNCLVGRAISDLRRRAPVLLHDDNQYLLVYPSELLDQQTLNGLASLSDEIYLLLTAERARVLWEEKAQLRVPAKNLTLDAIRALLMTAETDDTYKTATGLGSALDGAALQLVKLSRLLPSAIVMTMAFSGTEEMDFWCRKNHISSLDAELVKNYKADYKLDEVCCAELCLKNTLTKIFVFRSYIGEPEHYALVIGKPDLDNVVTRLHSSCYTGDLLGSLACDCRSQLLNTIDFLTSRNGGIILYVSQEGRGIGLANKIRAYDLQGKKGLDTVDANRFLGFDDDERVFLPATCMLKHLGVSRIQLLTNNPLKAQELRKQGIDVTKMIPLLGDATSYNHTYMQTKRERMGHNL